MYIGALHRQRVMVDVHGDVDVPGLPQRVWYVIRKCRISIRVHTGTRLTVHLTLVA